MPISPDQTGATAPDETVSYRFAVDLPLANSEEWEALDYFATREEAIRFARERFGADEEGRICLVSAMPDDDVEFED